MSFLLAFYWLLVPEDLISIAVHTGGETVLTQSDRSRTHILCRHLCWSFLTFAITGMASTIAGPPLSLRA